MVMDCADESGSRRPVPRSTPVTAAPVSTSDVIFPPETARVTEFHDGCNGTAATLVKRPTPKATHAGSILVTRTLASDVPISMVASSLARFPYFREIGPTAVRSLVDK